MSEGGEYSKTRCKGDGTAITQTRGLELAWGSGIICALFLLDTHKVLEGNMKADIHPRYEEITARCSCGNEIKTRSTLAQDITIDVCSRCHPFFTGKQKIVDSGGRVDRFNKRFAGRSLKK